METETRADRRIMLALLAVGPASERERGLIQNVPQGRRLRLRGTEAVTEPIAICPTILRSVKAFVLMACTVTLGVAFAANVHSEDQHEIDAAAAAPVRFLEMLEPAQARVAVLPPASPPSTFGIKLERPLSGTHPHPLGSFLPRIVA